MNNLIRPEGYQIQAPIWERLFQAKERNFNVSAQVVGITYPNDQPTWVLSFPDYSEIKGLVPATETDLSEINLMSKFVGQPINVRIKGLNQEEGMVACSRKEAVDSLRQKLFDQLKEGDLIKCVVKAVMARNEDKPARLLVDVGGGVLSEVSYRQAAIRLAQRLDQQYLLGQVVNAVVKQIDQGDIKVSIKDAYGDPWDKIDFRRGEFLSGTICFIRNNHVWVEPDMAPGVLGLTSIPLAGGLR
ncbi:MAG: 30S ribosomal protein S1, partial [Syntrophomonadaceae bacterium]|nr:30S ribosomal protein S1 [Syntrophomonadaceae bacterium]